jgi:hypothetical protein
MTVGYLLHHPSTAALLQQASFHLHLSDPSIAICVIQMFYPSQVTKVIKMKRMMKIVGTMTMTGTGTRTRTKRRRSRMTLTMAPTAAGRLRMLLKSEIMVCESGKFYT